MMVPIMMCPVNDIYLFLIPSYIYLRRQHQHELMMKVEAQQRAHPWGYSI